jgi:hypothetical protein
VFRIEPHVRETLRNVYDEISRHLTPADALLVLGPGQPKHRLASYIAEQKGRLGQVVHLDTVANVTEAELLAFAATFFDVEDTDSAMRSDGEPRFGAVDHTRSA